MDIYERWKRLQPLYSGFEDDVDADDDRIELKTIDRVFLVHVVDAAA